MVRVRELDDDEVLSHYGYERSDPPFRNELRQVEVDLDTGKSLQLGQLTVAEAAKAVPRREPVKGDMVRYTTVGTLRAAGFRVNHTPSPANTTHVSVKRDGSWDAEAFDACFTGEPRRYSDGDD